MCVYYKICLCVKITAGQTFNGLINGGLLTTWDSSYSFDITMLMICVGGYINLFGAKPLSVEHLWSEPTWTRHMRRCYTAKPPIIRLHKHFNLGTIINKRICDKISMTINIFTNKMASIMPKLKKADPANGELVPIWSWNTSQMTQNALLREVRCNGSNESSLTWK